MGRARALILVLALAGLLAAVVAPPVAAEPMESPNMYNTWARLDLPVANGAVSRTWMWGPSANTLALTEAYQQSPGGQRAVQYFDKSRMEVNNPGGDQSQAWYVTNGLLSKELITGRMQVGDDAFHPYAPAAMNVAGDLDDPNGPTYASFSQLMTYNPIPEGWTLTQTVDRAGNVGADPSLASHGVTAAYRVRIDGGNDHTVASVFWDFMNGAGTIWSGSANVNDRLFPNPFYATGYPLTEAYWTTILVGGVPTPVLVQVFERRVLTYTPANPAEWRVESGNVGLQYYQWRYGQLGMAPELWQQPPAAQPENPKVTVVGPTVDYYEIFGTTAAELRASMAQNGPTEYPGNFDAYTVWYITWPYVPGAGGLCRAAGVTLTVSIVFPHWTPPPGASQALVDEWNRYTAALMTHEYGHVDSARAGASRVVAAIESTPCANANAAAMAVLDQMRQQDEAYDARTGHGATQGAIFPMTWFD